MCPLVVPLVTALVGLPYGTGLRSEPPCAVPSLERPAILPSVCGIPVLGVVQPPLQQLCSALSPSCSGAAKGTCLVTFRHTRAGTFGASIRGEGIPQTDARVAAWPLFLNT